MAFYELEINHSQIGLERGFRFTARGDVDAGWGCQLHTIQTTSPESTMRVGGLTLVDHQEFSFVTLVACTAARIFFRTRRPLSHSMDALPGQLAIGDDPPQWLWRLHSWTDVNGAPGNRQSLIAVGGDAGCHLK